MVLAAHTSNLVATTARQATNTALRATNTALRAISTARSSHMAEKRVTDRAVCRHARETKIFPQPRVQATVAGLTIMSNLAASITVEDTLLACLNASSVVTKLT